MTRTSSYRSPLAEVGWPLIRLGYVGTWIRGPAHPETDRDHTLKGNNLFPIQAIDMSAQLVEEVRRGASSTGSKRTHHQEIATLYAMILS